MSTTIVNKFGVLQGWNSIKWNIYGRDVEGILKFAYDDTVEKENVYGSGKYPVGRAHKNYAATCSTTFLKEELDGIMKSLPKGKRLQDIAPDDIVVTYAMSDGSIQKDIIHNFEWTDNKREVAQGDGSIGIEVTFIVSHITWDAV